jgi:biotin synthase-like enzyme
MSKRRTQINIRVTEKERDYIYEKANELGFKSVASFIVNSTKDFFVVELDLSHFDNVAKEINYIGKNINNLIHHIFTIGAYSDHDLKEIQRLQKEVLNRVNKEYDYLLSLRKKYRESNMSLEDKERLIKELKKQDIEVPKEVIFGEIYEQIRNNVLYICQMIEDSPEQEDGISDYVYEYLFDGVLFDLDEDNLIEFANKIYFFSERIKMKLLKPDNYFDDDDWFDLKDILDEYEEF